MEVKLTVQSIDKAIEKLKLLKEEVCDGIVMEEVIEDLLSVGADAAYKFNSTAPKSGVLDNSVSTEIDENGTAGAIMLYGPNAVYDEFGTGTQGENSPHPMKNQFPLNPYNSGPYIFYNEFSGTYQWYYRAMAGKPYFTKNGATEGIPAGKIMYNTAKHLNGVKHDIIQRKFNDAIKKFK